MRIAFDHQAFCRQIAGGISRYYCRLASGLAVQQQDIGVFAPIYRNIYLKELPSKYVHGLSVRDYPPKFANLSVALNAMIARPMIRRWQPNIVHETYFSGRTMTPLNCPSVVTVFDMIGEFDAAMRPRLQADLRHTDKFKAVNRADHVICISESARQDLIEIFQIPKDKTSVVYLGCDFIHYHSVADIQINIGKKPYLLYVGLRAGYKNFEGLLRAISASHRLKSSFDIVAFGGGPFNSNEQSLIKNLGFDSEQIQQKNGTDQDLITLYQQAQALIYPSKYEGFGLPPLEAMSLSCPVISSNRSSMPEIICDAAEYFDPDHTESMKTAIENVVLSPTKAQELIQKGKARVQKFTWTQCAEKTLDIYQTLQKSNS